METTFDDAKPSLTHMALVKLVEENVVQYVVSQNVDGLHIKSGLSRYFNFPYDSLRGRGRRRWERAVLYTLDNVQLTYIQ